MEKTLIMSLQNHHIYYVTDNKAAFYIAVPYQKYSSTNICIELRDDTQGLTFSQANIVALRQRLGLIYSKIDNYNISLIIPVLSANFLNTLKTTNDQRTFMMLDKALAKVINYGYMVISSDNVKVNNEIIMVNNGTYTHFNTWFVQRYGDRCKYKSIMDMVQEQAPVSDDNLDKVELSGINFVVGKEQEEIKKEETPQQNLDLDSTLILDTVDIPEDEPPVRKEAHQAGYVSYYLLGVFSIAISLVILYLLL